MESVNDITIPGWAIGIFFLILLPWMLYLTKGMNDNQRQIDINNSNDKNVTAELKRIYHLIEKMDVKLDGFLAKEYHFMKGMLLKDRKSAEESEE